MNRDEYFMHRCIQLAKNGRKNAQPNPMVGAVIVYDGQIIGEGYHVRRGEGHAEVNAVASVKQEHRPLLSQSTIYVTLEPCSHYGKTPPCADMLVEKGFKRVVIGCVDPNEKVKGRGIQKLKDAGIEVEVGVCREECEELNKVFFTYHRLCRPYVTLKWAQSRDGFIGREVNKDEARMGEDHRISISNQYSQMISHKLRTEHQAILVGKKTLVNDNPSLTVREWKGRNPIRIVLTHNDDFPREMKVFSNDAETLIMEGDIEKVLHELYERGIQSLLVEGGSEVHQQFIDSGFWDEIRIEQGEMMLNEGTEAPHFDKTKVGHRAFDFFGTHFDIYTKKSEI